MKKLQFISFATTLVSLVIILTAVLSMPTPVAAQDATILIYSDPRPGEHAGKAAALLDDFNQADDQIPPGWNLDCVQNSGDIDTIAALDSVYYDENSDLKSLPHFMCVGNHEAADVDVMNDIRDKFLGIPGDSDYPGYPHWNLNTGPVGTSETTYSYDVGDIHIIVLNEYWNGAGNDACLNEACISEDVNPGFDGGYIVDELFEWTKEDLRSSTKPYKIIVGHEPGYPVGRHVGDSLDSNPENRDKFFNLLRTEGVIAYFTSHTHFYDLSEHDGVFQVNTGVCGGHVYTPPGSDVWDNFATLGYAHCDGSGFQIRVVREHPVASWAAPIITTKTRSDLKTQILVNAAEGAGTVCRYFIDYTEAVEPNPDWSTYGVWWENNFDDIGAGWRDGEFGVGYDSTNPAGWGWINETIDPDPTSTGDEEVYGVFARIPFTVHDKEAYPFMKLGVDYDDAITVWINSTKIYESPASPTISSSDYWDKLATGGHEANGDEALNPIFDFIDVSAYMGSLNEGDNLLVIGNWNRSPDSSDLVAGVKLYLTVNPVSGRETWKYDDTGTDLGTIWKEHSYDDSAWDSGPAELGYGDGDEATEIAYGGNPSDKYPCYYFRHAFNISDPSDYDSLTLKVLRDDGAVVYLNGVEIFRTNMPSGAITYDTWASSAIGGTNESSWYETRVDAGYLVDGTNIIAVEVHQSSADSSDVSFDLQLTAPAIILLSPDDSVVLPVFPPATFVWDTDASSRFKIEFSPTSSFPRAFPTLSEPRRFWMRDTSTDTIPRWRWHNIWNKIRNMERRHGIVYWRVIGKTGPSAPIDISEVRSFSIIR